MICFFLNLLIPSNCGHLSIHFNPNNQIYRNDPNLKLMLSGRTDAFFLILVFFRFVYENPWSNFSSRCCKHYFLWHNIRCFLRFLLRDGTRICSLVYFCRFYSRVVQLLRLMFWNCHRFSCGRAFPMEIEGQVDRRNFC